MTTICLSMIVKNEAAVIARCLQSVMPLIDTWCIVDTGSTDKTKEIILSTLKGLPGELRTRSWLDFAHNRSEALALARDRADYTLVIDADDELIVPDGLKLPDLTADSYEVDFTDTGGVSYRRAQIVKNTLPWQYRGVLHEFLECKDAKVSGYLPLMIRRGHDGARRKNPETYRQDAEILLSALKTESDPLMRARYTFYLAQSYKDCGEKERAIERYLTRAKMGFWQDEVYVSLLYAARLKDQLGHADTLGAYLNASWSLDSRAEAAHDAARYCRLHGRNEEGYDIAKSRLAVGIPTGGLFVEPWIYEYGLRDEFAVNAYWAGHKDECADACHRLLRQQGGSEEDRARFAANLRACGQGITDIVQTENVTLQEGAPRVLLAILAKQKADVLPLYLECIETLDYPKSSIVLSVRTNNNTDATKEILVDWLGRVGHLYAGVEFDDSDVPEAVQDYAPHDWNGVRLSVIRRLRNESIARTKAHECAFYFVVDCDNFIRPETLRELVSLGLPIVAPFLRLVDLDRAYSNYHAAIDANGYYADCEEYFWIVNQRVKGIIEVPVVHCTYLVRADVIDRLTYEDGAERFDYVTFSHSARRAGISQYLDNRRIYGHLVFDQSSELYVEDGLAKARKLLGR